MAKIIITEEQLYLLSDFAESKGKILAKHLPLSSKFRSIAGDWKSIWVKKYGEDKWPDDSKEMISTCHIVDVKSRKVYLYPMPQSQNAAVEGYEDEMFFLADKTRLLEFSLTDVDDKNLEQSPSELLKQALSKISFL